MMAMPDSLDLTDVLIACLVSGECKGNDGGQRYLSTNAMPRRLTCDSSVLYM